MTPIMILLKASIMISAAMLAHALFGRRMSAAARHLVWTFAAAGLLLLPALSFVLPAWPAFTAPARDIRVPQTVTQRSGVPTPEDFEVRSLPDRPVAWSQVTTAAPPRIPWSSILAGLYAAGALLLLVRLVVERLSLQRLMQRGALVRDPEWVHLLNECAERMGVRRPVVLIRSREETMPMASGIRHGAIMIPAVADTWSEDRRRAVLLHEMAHLSRHDCLIQMMAAVACALYWIHPGVWWIARRLRVERELACDDRVLAAGANAREYAGHLLEIAYALRSGRSLALAVSMAGSGQLEGRMLAVLDAARNRAAPALRSHLAGLIILAVLLVPLAAATTSVQQKASIIEVAPSEATEVASLISAAASPAQQTALPNPSLPGTWAIRPTDRPRFIQVEVSDGNSSHSSTVDLDRPNGFPVEQFVGASGPVQFVLRRDAGAFIFEGIVRNGVGAGTFTFTPDPNFAAEMAKRGLARPTAAEQRVLAGADIGLSFLDELAAQNYERPANMGELVRAAQHGVTLSYLREMGGAGIRAGRLDSLINLANHGVSPQFIRELAAEGLSGLSINDLLRARNQGVDPEYVRELRSLGFARLSLDELVRLRNHGVDPEYVRELAGLGYSGLSLDALVELRNHGVDPEYVRELSALGYTNQSLNALTQLRNNGVDPEYIRELGALGYTKLSLEALTRLRNHGVDPEYVRELGALGYRNLPLDTLVELRNHGVDPEYVRGLQRLGYNGLKPEELVNMRSRGFNDGQRLEGLNRWLEALRDFIR